ncbi:hypothetical protein BaRGS_00011289, partial [Batillaria attramentaria]
PSAPVITGYQPGQVLFLGDTLLITCSVSGGDPLVTSVTFYCGHMDDDTNDIRNDTQVSSQVIIDPLRAEHNGMQCACVASWPKDQQLDLSTKVILIVEGAPLQGDKGTVQNPLHLFVMDGTQSMTFNIVAFPTPLVSIVFLGSSLLVDDNSEQGKTSDVLNARCVPTATVFQSACTVTADKPESEDEGFYNVTVRNNFGEASYIVQLSLAQSAGSDTYDRPMPRQQEDNYTDLVLYEDVGNKQVQTGTAPSAPVIAGYQPGQVVSVGDTLVMTCSVNGGDPLVTSITFHCGSTADGLDKRNTTHVSSQVTIRSVRADHNGTLCVCKALWPKDEQLELNRNVTLLIEEKQTEETTIGQYGSSQPGTGPGEENQSSRNGTEGHPDDEFVEHNNFLYEPGDSPYEVNDAYQPASSESTVQKQPAATTVDPTYEDHNLDSYDDGYAAVSAGSPQENGNVFQTHTQSSLDHDLYSSVDAPTSNIPAAVSGPAAQGDEYAVVDKSKKRNTEPTFQPDVYAQVNKSRPKTGGDVYAQVNKPAKRANSSPMQHDIDEGDGNYAELNPKSTSGSVETSGGDDEYNVLRFQGRNSDTPANPDAGQLYSHIEPPDPPVIAGYRPGQVFHIGGALTLLCIVNGGTPKVKTVAFFCGEHKDSEDVVHQTAVFSAVIIDSLSETDNGTVCNCSARWEKDSTISLTTSITLIVEGQSAPTTVYIETSSKDTNEGGTEESTFPVAAVAGGIGALLAIIGIVIVIIIVVRRLRMKTYDRPSRRRDQDANPYTGLRPTGADSSRISGTANAQGGNEEGQQLASNTRGRLKIPPTEANELRDISNTTASAHAYQNTLQSSAN